MIRHEEKEIARIARKKRIRKKIRGTQERPRLCVKKSLKHMIVQLIDDTRGRSLLQVTSSSKEIQIEKVSLKGKIGISKRIGNIIAEKAAALGVKRMVFDRGGYSFHGRIKAVADGIREKGMEL